MKPFLFLFLLLSSNLVQAEIYSWTDKNGTLHFSDRPIEDARLFILPEIQGYSASAQIKIDFNDIKPESAKKDYYQVIAIIQPENKATIRDNQGELLVSVFLMPVLRADDRLKLVYDGKILEMTQTSSTFLLNNVERGAHTLAAQVVNKELKVLKTSKVITIFMHRALKNKKAPLKIISITHI